MRSIIFRWFFSVVILLPVSAVRSEGLSFDYVQAFYISDTVNLAGSIDEVEGDGIGFALSLSFAPAFAMTLNVAATTFKNFQGKRVDTSKTTALGVTAHTSIAQDTEIFSNLSVVKAELTADNGAVSTSDSDFGGIVNVGLRHQLTDIFEFEVSASHVKVFGYGVNLYAVDGRFYIRKNVSLGFGYEGSDELESLLLKLRADI